MMNNMNELLSLDISIIEENDEKRDYALRQLRREIETLGIEDVNALSEPQTVDAGAKSIDPATLNALLLSITPITLTKVLEFMHSWITRKEGRTIKIKIQKSRGTTIEVEIPSSMSSKELKQLIKTVETSISNNSK